VLHSRAVWLALSSRDFSRLGENPVPAPEAVSQLATEAHKQNPSIVDTVSGFYAQHPTLVKGLGAAALAIAMSHMPKRAA
jgi:hypothetical protein